MFIVSVGPSGIKYVSTRDGLGGWKVDKNGTRRASDDVKFAEYIACDIRLALRRSAVRFEPDLVAVAHKFKPTRSCEIRDVLNFRSGGGGLLPNLI